MLRGNNARQWLRPEWRILPFLLLLAVPAGNGALLRAAEPADTAPAPVFAPKRDDAAEYRPLNFHKESATRLPKAERSGQNSAQTDSGNTDAAPASNGPLRSLEDNSPENQRRKGTSSTVGAVVFVVVILGFFLYLGLLLLKKIMPGGKALFSSPAMEILGRTHFEPQRYLALVRVGKRLLVVGVSPGGFSPVSEISDAEEAADLMAVAKPKTGAGKTIFHRLFQSQLANAERESFLTSAQGQTPAEPVWQAGEEPAGEFAAPGMIPENYEQARARMQEQIRNLRENEQG